MDSSCSSQQASKKTKQPKELRFITNHGAPHPKRRRISAACLTCRKRKVACSGEKPVCITCSQNKIDCAGYDGGGGGGDGSSSNDKSSQGRDGAEASQTKIKPERRGSHADTHASTQQAFGRAFPTVKTDRSNSVASAQSASSVGNENDARTHERLADIPEERSSGSGSSASLFSNPKNRMPYFRWLGPTAIMPGFKQMVVKVKRQDTINGVSSNHSGEGAGVIASPSAHRTGSVLSNTPLTHDPDMRTPLALPFYDTSTMPPSGLITHLCNTFFTHLGCNFPFLQRERFLKDLEEKQVDAILVDAVCAMAARFSNHELLTNQARDGGKSIPSEYGAAFAQRAKEALIHTFATPNVAAVQAALLLAYNEFGESRDSGLWMYLGISIRIAQDLGLQKLDGLCYEGRDGPTPKMVKMDVNSQHMEEEERKKNVKSPPENEKEADEQRAVERERIDTFWAVFFLDRVVSSGTGRRSTLRDKDIELSFPSLDTIDDKTGWPSPFPALIRIVHLYGRVADLLNCIKGPSDITEDTPRRLADMETRVTNLYQGLSPKLHFQAMNFHHYVKAGEGTNFVLLHFWFHTLIVLLHQPTLFKTFEGKMLQLFPNSQHISMSSAKTIADILSYSQLIDAKASLGNPFTTQPIYIAACAFLKESAEQTATSKEQSRTQSTAASRATSPTATNSTAAKTAAGGHAQSPLSSLPLTAADRLLARHTLLATAASQHYQLCYKALESLEVYWAGTKYILTVLDQKFKGVGDPLLYTAEEGEGSIEKPNPEAKEAFRGAGWRRKIDWAGLGGSWLGSVGGVGAVAGVNMSASQMRGGPLGPGEDVEGNDPNSAIGWTLTGTMNSPSTNLAWHFPPMHASSSSYHARTSSQHIDPLMTPYDFTSPMMQPAAAASTSMHASNQMRSSPRGSHSRNHSHSHRYHGGGDSNTLLDPALSFVNTRGGHMGGSVHTQYNHSAIRASNSNTLVRYDLNGYTIPNFHDSEHTGHGGPGIDGSNDTSGARTTGAGHETGPGPGTGTGNNNDAPPMQFFGDMLIESQDVDTSLLGLDTLPWFEMEGLGEGL